MNREMGQDLQRCVQGVVGRIFEERLGVDVGGAIMGRGVAGTPMSERSNSVFGGGSRRGSRGR